MIFHKIFKGIWFPLHVFEEASSRTRADTLSLADLFVKHTACFILLVVLYFYGTLHAMILHRALRRLLLFLLIEALLLAGFTWFALHVSDIEQHDARKADEVTEKQIEKPTAMSTSHQGRSSQVGSRKRTIARGGFIHTAAMNTDVAAVAERIGEHTPIHVGLAAEHKRVNVELLHDGDAFFSKVNIRCRSTVFTWDQARELVAKSSRNTDKQYIAIHRYLLDVTDFRHVHPGGRTIEAAFGKMNSVELFMQHHRSSIGEQLSPLCIGVVQY